MIRTSNWLEAYLAPEQRERILRPDPPPLDQPAPRDPSRRTILVLDNEQTNLDLTTSVLGYGGYAVVTASDLNSALERAREAPPALIISDVCMPQGNGFEFIAKVKQDEELSAIPFVFVTSTATDEQSRQKGLALGAAQFLLRPIEPQALLDLVAGYLKGPDDG